MIYKWADASFVWSLILRYLPEDNLQAQWWEGRRLDIRTDVKSVRTDLHNIRTDVHYFKVRDLSKSVRTHFASVRM